MKNTKAEKGWAYFERGNPQPSIKLLKSQTLFRKGKGGKKNEKVCSMLGMRTETL